ncbi:protein mono-ADP-ribosyltransferase PARP12-like [Sceloporus undulatus]|uniref:protein mono-ADP-ribosyltransferase PARP12-like n=1 Tax=Sceloporus undulatus TaxID=8520 RepID=UPI001C4C92D0|nr:protein mono-ADP-ribosyltransferase PARP12-like [Sceloporus undulatus]
MTKKGGQYIDERLLFHGTSSSNVEAICNDNFDWRICGANGIVFGRGSYFARDARYSHSYCQRDTKTKVMFVAQVLVGDFIVGCASYSRPPAKSTNKLHYYDSCVDNMTDPSIFVIFEKHQIYPAYTIDYSEEDKCLLS